MECNNNEIADLLPDYFSGHLEYELQKRVESHLRDCPDCQESLKAMQLLAGQLVTGLDGQPEHVNPQTLGAYFRNPELVSKTDRAFVEEHIKTCEQCAYDFDFLREMEPELRASVKADLARPSLLARLFHAIPVLIRKPVFAYFIVALLIYPASKYLVSLDRTDKSAEVVTLTNINRSAGRVPIVYRDKRQKTIKFILPEYHSVSRFDYYVRLRNSRSQSTMLPEAITDFSRTGEIGLTLKISSLPDGSYDLEILEVDLQDRSDTTTTVFPFELNSL